MVDLGFQVLASGSTGLGALGVSWSAFVIQLITFILAYLVLRKWAFGPIIRVLKERRDKIANGVSLAEKMEQEKIELEQRVAKEIAEARTKADDILAGASEAAKEAIRKSEVEAEAKADVIIAEAKDRTKQDMQRAKRALEGEIVNLVSEATEVITGEKVDKSKDSKLIERSLAGRL